MNKRKTRQYNYCRNDNITLSWIQSTHVWRNLTFTSNTNHGEVNAILVNKTEVSSSKTAVVVHCCRARECDTWPKNATAASCTERGGKRNSWLARADQMIRGQKTDGQAHISPLLCQLVSSYRAGADWNSDARRVVTSQAQAATRYQYLFRTFRN